MLKSKRNVCVSLIIALGLSLIVLCPVDAIGQKPGKGRYAGRKVSVTKNARKNGYTTTTEGNEIYFEANGVEHPTTEELLEALRKLLFRCREDEPLRELPLRFSRGRSERVKVQCLILITPQILIDDEPGTN